jgi:hypothetical protein
VNPKIPAAARISTRQDLVDKVLNGDQELISRIKDLYDQQTNFY